jgi:RNA polymerase sigma factor (sigma-70 family)
MDNRRLETVLHHLRKLICPAAVTSLSDGELLERFVSQHDQAAFELLVRRHGGLVWNLCRRLLGNAADADDAFQATFLVLVRRAASLDRRGSVAGWLYGVAYRIAVRARANGARGRWRERRAASEQASETRVDSAVGELRQALDEELSELPAKYRMPIVLCYLEGKTHAEAASELGWPLGTLKCRVLRARERLRQRLSGRGLTVSAVALTAMLGREAAGAEVPMLLIHSTLKATLLAEVSAKSAALAEGVLRAMLVNKIKIATSVVLAVLLLGSGAGALVQQVGIPEQAAAAPVGELLADEPANAKPQAASDNSALAAVWADLASDDETEALKAVFALAATPKESVTFLKQNLKPVTIDPKRIARLLANLDSDQFTVREQATQELESMGSYAAPYLHGVLDKKPALEVRQRVEQILERIKSSMPSAGVIRSLRAIAVLEYIGSNDARQLLEALSRGRTKALTTQEAEAALDRLTERPGTTVRGHYELLTMTADVSVEGQRSRVKMEESELTRYKSLFATGALAEGLVREKELLLASEKAKLAALEAGNDAGQVARALLALAATPKETVQFLADEVKKADENKAKAKATKGAAKEAPRDAREAEREALLRALDFAVRAQGGGSPASAKSSAPSIETITKRIAILLDQIGTPEAKAVLEAIQQGKLTPGPAGGKTAVSPDGKLKAAIENAGVSVWDVATGKQLWHAKAPVELTGVRFSDDGRFVFTDTIEGGTPGYGWDPMTGKLLMSAEPIRKR